MFDMEQQEQNLQSLWVKKKYHEYFVELMQYTPSDACQLLQPNLRAVLNGECVLDEAQKAELIKDIYELRGWSDINLCPFPDKAKALRTLDAALKELRTPVKELAKEIIQAPSLVPEIQHPGFKDEKFLPSFIIHQVQRAALCLEKLVRT